MLGLLHHRGPLRRAELTELTGLNKSTVMSLVEELEGLRLVQVGTAVSDGSRGRPSAMVSPHETGVVVVASEIGVDFARVAVVGLGGGVLRGADVPVNPAALGPDATAQAIGVASLELLHGGPNVVAAATAIHGLVSLDGRLPTAPNLGWVGLDLAAQAAPFRPAGVPVFFGNDADLGALGEHRRGAGQGRSDLLYLSAERGIGGGLVRDHELQRGVQGYATEVGHLVVNRNGTRCGCGSRGCLETEIGLTALRSKAGLKANDQRGAEAVLEAARRGHPDAAAAVADVAEWLGFAIGNLAKMFDPGMVVLGGYLGDVLAFARSAVERELAATAMEPAVHALTVVPSALGGDAALAGAAEFAFASLLNNPGSVLGPNQSAVTPKEFA